MTKFYTTEEIAELLHMSVGNARNRLSRQDEMPPSVKVGRRRLFPMAQFDEWVSKLEGNLPAKQIAEPLPVGRGRPRKGQRNGLSQHTRINV